MGSRGLRPDDQRQRFVYGSELGGVETPRRSTQPSRVYDGRLLDEHARLVTGKLDRRSEARSQRACRGRGHQRRAQLEELVSLDDEDLAANHCQRGRSAPARPAARERDASLPYHPHPRRFSEPQLATQTADAVGPRLPGARAAPRRSPSAAHHGRPRARELQLRRVGREASVTFHWCSTIRATKLSDSGQARRSAR